MSDRYPMTDYRQIRSFALAGDAKISLRSKKSGKHFTYRIKEGHGGMWWVTRKTTDDYIYLGLIDSSGFRASQKTTAEARISKQFDVFLWFWTMLSIKDRIHPDLEVFHEGSCGACGRELTDPESVRTGFGPTCTQRRLLLTPPEHILFPIDSGACYETDRNSSP